AEAARLQHGWSAESIERRHQIIAAIDRLEGDRWDAKPVEQRLLDEAILRRFEGNRRRIDWHPSREPLGRRDRHVLELVGDDVEAVGEAVERIVVVVAADLELASDLRARLRRRVEEAKAQAER